MRDVGAEGRIRGVGSDVGFGDLSGRPGALAQFGRGHLAGRQETGDGRREAAGSCGIEDSETRAYRAMLGLDAYARVLEDSGPTHWGFLGT